MHYFYTINFIKAFVLVYYRKPTKKYSYYGGSVNVIAGILNYLPLALKCIVLTCLIELAIAFLYKIYNYKVILVANVSTQLLLHVVNITMFYIYRPMYKYGQQIFLGTEVVILILEYLIYCKFVGDKRKFVLFVYALTANLVTFLTGLLIQL